MIFGIDLGTSNSCISYLDKNNMATVIKNLEGNLTTPSVVYWDEDDNKFIIGEIAKNALATDPDNVITYIKRDMGSTTSHFIGKKEFSPEEISSEILKSLISSAREVLEREGVPLDDENKVIITVPAYFGAAERSATAKAGELAGLTVLQIINEPTAAAYSYGLLETNKDERKNVVVYDLGGGTFDITIISVDEAITTLATAGDHLLGGKNWDEEISRYLCEKFENEYGTTPTDDSEVISQLLLDIEIAKKTLTTQSKATINIKHEGNKLKETITREDFDKITTPLLNRTIELFQTAIEEAKLKDKNLVIDEILLVGGSSKMPQVKKALEKFGYKILMFDPDESVSKGATLYAKNCDLRNEKIENIAENLNITEEEVVEKIKNNDTTGMNEEDVLFLASSKKIVNVSSRSYGIKARSNDKTIIKHIIKRNDALPAKASQIFHPTDNNQSDVCIEVYESQSIDDEIDLDIGVKIGDCVLELPAGTTTADNIEILLGLGEDGLLNVRGKEIKTGKVIEATINIVKSNELQISE